MANLSAAEKEAFTNAWKLACKWRDIRMVREQWDSFNDEALAMCRAGADGGCERLACGLAVAIHEWLEEEARRVDSGR